MYFTFRDIGSVPNIYPIVLMSVTVIYIYIEGDRRFLAATQVCPIVI